jgi:ABC-2 type transport system ATP-binding protein
MTALVEIRDLVFEYPGFRALHGVSAEIAAGTITALVGPNGAGKTTLLRCLAALDQPYQGTIHLDGLDIHEHPRDGHRMMGYLSDFFGLYDNLTVRQCLTHRARIHALDAEEEAIAWAADAVRLTDRLGHKAGDLSRGLRQRLAIGQAIIHKPKLLMLDEPASGLDPEARQDLADLLTALRGMGITIVVSSHILAELEAYSSHMLIIDQGRILEHAPTGTAAAAPDRPVAIALSLAEPFPGLADLLAGEAEEFAAEGQQARFTLAGGAEAQQRVLKKLIEAGVPVTAFAPVAVNLQDAYIERVRRERGA